jgi:hypothetical protein
MTDGDRRSIERDTPDRRTPAPGGDIYEVLRDLGASEALIEALAMVTGGRQIWHPELPAMRRKERRRALRQAVLADTSGDVKDVAHRHGVALSTVYFWRNQAG